jgi:hypothetical protein
LEGIKESFSSRAVKAMIERVLGTEVADLTTADEFAGQMETKLMLVTNYLPRLNPDVATVLRLVFLNPDATDFQAFLESNCVPGSETPVEPVASETSETSETEPANEGDGTFPLDTEESEPKSE